MATATDTTALDAVIPLIYAAARDAATFSTPMRNIIPGDSSLVGKPGQTVTHPIWPDVSDADDVSEMESYTTSETLTPSPITSKPTKKRKMLRLSIEAVQAANEDVMARFGRKIGSAVAHKDDKSALALFSGLSTHSDVGSSSTRLVPSEIIQAKTVLQMTPCPDMLEENLFFVQSAYVLNDLMATILAAGNIYGVWTAIDNSQIAKSLNMATFLGVTMVPDGNMTEAGTKYYLGCMFHKDAFVRTAKRPFAIAKEWDEGSESWNMYGTESWVYTELEDKYAVPSTNLHAF